jgi:hypothetical protein
MKYMALAHWAMAIVIALNLFTGIQRQGHSKDPHQAQSVTGRVAYLRLLSLSMTMDVYCWVWCEESSDGRWWMMRRCGERARESERARERRRSRGNKAGESGEERNEMWIRL